MKKIALLALLSFLLSAALFAQDNKKGAVVKFENLVHDYGSIFQGADGICEFKFTNTGDEPLVLSSVRSSCGCTVPSYPKDPILPGQSNFIKVSYDTKRLGPISKQITVVSNASEPTIQLSIKGNILQKPNEILPEKQINEGFTPTAN
jgi:hypothetical protein